MNGDRDPVLRRALWVSVPYNLGGAGAFAFPDTFGRLLGLAGPVPPIYAAGLAFLVVLFAGTYAWLAVQPHIDRPLVAFAAIGKSGFFAVVLACWLAGTASGLAVLATTGDLALAAVFAWWLRAGPDLVRQPEPIA